MKKKLISLIAAAAMLCAVPSSLAEDEDVTVLINGEQLVIAENETKPFIDNDRTLVPMRAIFEALGATVSWEEETQLIVSYDPSTSTSILLQIDNKTMFVNEEPIELDVPARLEGDRTFVPLRAVAEGMKCDVAWDEETCTVTVTKEITEPVIGMPNPWVDYSTLDELNAAIGEAEGHKYVVAAPTRKEVDANETVFRYLPISNMAEIQGVWAIGTGAEFVIRTAPEDQTEDPGAFVGIETAEKTGEYTLPSGAKAEVYAAVEKPEAAQDAEETGEKSDEEADKKADEKANEEAAEDIDDSIYTVYAIWADDGLTHSVCVNAVGWDPEEVVKQLADDVDENYPRG